MALPAGRPFALLVSGAAATGGRANGGGGRSQVRSLTHPALAS